MFSPAPRSGYNLSAPDASLLNGRDEDLQDFTATDGGLVHDYDGAQMTHEEDLLNWSSPSMQANLDGTKSPISEASDDGPPSKRQRKSRFGQLDYTDAVDLSKSEYEDSIAGDFASYCISDQDAESESDFDNSLLCNSVVRDEPSRE